MSLLAFVAAIGAQAIGAAGVTPDQHFPIPTCESVPLAPSVERLVKPVLLARVKARRLRIEWDKAFEDAFNQLLGMRGSVAREARVALMAYYTGEHYGEELLEDALAHPVESDPLIRRYRACRPRVTFENQLSGILVLRTLYVNYEDQRARGKSPDQLRAPGAR